MIFIAKAEKIFLSKFRSEILKPKVIILLTLLTAKTLASTCKTSPGFVSCNSGTAPGLEAQGIAELNATNFTDKVLVYGQLSADNCSFSDIEVHGLSHISYSKLAKDGYFYGMTTLENSSNMNKIEIFSNKAIIKDSKLNDIFIEGNSDTKLIVTNSIISGDITFNGSFGKVICIANCNISGKIHNGKLETKGEDNAQ